MKKKSRYSRWLKNTSSRKLIFSDLGLTFRPGEAKDIFLSNPDLQHVSVVYSERFGLLKKYYDSGDMIVLPGEPKKEAPYRTGYKTASLPIFDRSRSCVEIDPNESNFIDQLEEEFMVDTSELDEAELARINEKFVEEVDLDGFVDENFIDVEE